MSHERVTLLNDAAETGDPVLWPGGLLSFQCVGTFDGATVTLQILGPDGATWIDADSTTTITAAGGGNVLLPRGTIRALVAGGSPSGLFAVAARA